MAPVVQAGSVPPLTGELLGQVQNASGVVQMGAAVYLYNRYDQLVRQTLTNETGKFAFDTLPPDLYSVRVVLASFMPAIRRNISIAAGSENVLRINLASVLSTVELLPASAAQGTLMTDDWKWVLRSSQATRPVLRLIPVDSSSRPRSTLATFSETTGVLRLSAGDGDSASGSASQDLGTAFAVATLVNGKSRVRLSGNLGYMANSGLPAAGFRTTYSREEDGAAGPQVALTVHQIAFPGIGPAGASSETGPVLRSAAFSASDSLDFSDHLRLEYGGHVESIALLNRINSVSPYARATYDFGDKGALRVAFSSGTQPTELMSRDVLGSNGEWNASPDLNQDLAALSILPRISLRNGQMRLQRDQNWEVGYAVTDGSRKYAVSVYTEDVADAAYSAFGAVGSLPAGDLLRDVDSTSYILDIGAYRRAGITAAVTQSVGDHMDITVAGGRAGGLVASGDSRWVRKAERAWLSARASATLPGTGTRVVTSYGWTDPNTLMPIHFSLTGPTYQDVGWNIMVRQPLPRMGGIPGRMEATAEMQNALGQGYLPIGPSGSRTLLTNSPRALRGGLSFLF